jgi:hypothetical protein
MCEMSEKVYEIGQDTWGVATEIMASDNGKKLICKTYFNGNGASKVRFVIVYKNHTNQEEYETFDRAAKIYNALD